MNGQLDNRRMGLLLCTVAALAIAPGCTDDEELGELGALEARTEPAERAGSPAFHAVRGSGWAWVLADGAVGGAYFYNSTGGAVVGAKLGTGQYGVDFYGIQTGGSAQVVAYGGNAYCKLPTIPLANGEKTWVSVTCYSPTGSLTDSAFVVFFDARAGMVASPRGGAHLSTGGGTSPTVITSNSWNSSGATNTIDWSPAYNWYVATLPGMTSANAAVHVTAYGGNPYRCKVLFWGTGVVYVRCHDPAGNPAASGFSLSYLERSLLPGHVGGHAWITGGNVGAGYAAAEGRVDCLSDGSFSVAPNVWSTRDLDVSLTASDWAADYGAWVVPVVTAYGSTSEYCSIVSWGALPSGTTTVQVRCFDRLGNQIDASSTAFTSSITNRYGPEPC